LNSGSEQILIKEFYEIYEIYEIDYNIPSVVYHYTSAAALLSILENNSLWLFDRKYMNDVMDSSYIEGRFKEKCSDDFKQTNLLSPFVQQYVFSTTKAYDSFFHYNCYGNYCIAFSTVNLIDYIANCIKTFGPHDGIAHLFTYSNVIYDESVVDKLCSIIPVEKEKSLINNRNTRFSQFKEFGKWRSIYKHFSAIIKQKGFACEQEFRFLIETKSKQKYLLNKTKTGVIPYLDIKIPDVLLTIKSIKIGPLANSEEIECLRNFLLNRYGYKDIDISLSDLKIRKI